MLYIHYLNRMTRHRCLISVLNIWCRAEILPPNSVAVGVLTEARYFGLWELESRLSILPSISSLIVKENHRSQFPNYSEVLSIISQGRSSTKCLNLRTFNWRCSVPFLLLWCSGKKENCPNSNGERHRFQNRRSSDLRVSSKICS